MVFKATLIPTGSWIPAKIGKPMLRFALGVLFE